MKKFGKLEGKKYTFKKGTLKKNKKKYLETFEYILKDILNSEKLLDSFKKLITISNESKIKITNTVMLKLMESLAKDFSLDETIIYSEKKFNKLLIKKLKSQNSKEIKSLQKMINDLTKSKKSLRKKIVLNPWGYLKAIYLYTISEA